MRLAALFLLALAATACQSPEEQMEDQVQNLLSQRGNVQEVELAEGDDGNMTGHATVAAASGQSSRYNCSATKTGESTRYNISCIPAVDEAVLQATEAEIRGALEGRGVEVLEIDMQRHNDDNHMRGNARVRENEIDLRLACTAERDMTTLQFSFACAPAGPGASDEAQADQAEGEGGK